MTEEQQAVVDTILSSESDNRIVAVQAVAGSGKSTTSVEVAKAFKPKRGFYTAFNKGIVQESASKFRTLLESKTMHSMAYKYINPSKVAELSYDVIKEPITYPQKKELIKALDDFYRSEFTTFDDYFNSVFLEPEIEDLVVSYANKMLTGKIPVTFNYLLKCFHLMLEEGSINPQYDLFIYDECLVGSTKVSTILGDRTIKSICLDLQKGKQVLVKSFNKVTKEFEYKEAINPLISKGRETITLGTEGLNSITCTPNHRILTQRGYIQAEDIILEKDYCILDAPSKQKTKLLLNDDQLQVVLGSYLGDGCLNKRSRLNTYRLSITQGVKQLNYLKWKADCLNIGNNIKNIRSGYTGKYTIYQTNTSSTFILDDTPFNLVLSKLNLLGLAIWYQDDGSAQFIHSSSFTYEENLKLQEMLLHRFKLDSFIKQDKKGYYYLYLTPKGYLRLKELIKDYIHPDLEYKLGYCNHDIRALDNKYKNYGANFFTVKVPNVELQTVYDFEVKDNHNFLVSSSRHATKMVVHNCQDAVPVSLEIFKLLDCKKKLMLGDRYQNIYSFLNTVNGFKLIEDRIDLSLTKSFRCCEAVAEQVQNFGREKLTSKFKFIGNELLLDKPNDDKVYLSLTNSDLIVRMYDLIKEGKGFSSTRTIDEIFSLPFSIIFAAAGKPINDPRYKFIEDERKKWLVNTNGKTFFQHLDNLGLDEVSSAINTLKSFNKQDINIFKLKDAVRKVKPSKAITLSTAHSFKGLERPVAVIERNLVDKMKMYNEEEVNNLYYVALSRAMYEVRLN